MCHLYKDYINTRIILNQAENLEAVITNYTVYGTHLNIEGEINLSNANKVELALLNLQREEKIYSLNFEYNNKLKFNLSENINEGINLDELDINNYIVLLKVDDKYYNFTNSTNYPNITYYTITKNNHNNKVYIDFKNQYEKNYFNINVANTYIKEYYDIVIDAGHGGKDTGAISGKNYESTYTLSYALDLKKSLENLGLRVKLTRDSNERLDTYGINGRAVIPNKVKAKYLISIHLNSNVTNIFRGLEIYKANKTNNNFATILANNIKNKVEMPYSNNSHMKVQDGIYERTFKEEEIIESINNAKSIGYEPYPITTETNYLYIIRETGGIMTNAYTDGRNKNYDKNPYYNSNIGCEAYLIELGYIINNKDLNIIKNNKENYVKAITDSIKQYLNI